MGRLAKQLVPVGLVLAVCVAVFWNGLYGSFFFDDATNILYVENLQLTELSLPALREAWNSGLAGPSGRPVAQVSFALNHYFSGFDPFAFKLTNLVIHLLAGVLVFFTARRLLIAPVFAGLVAALWLLSPIQLTSVLYVVQRMTSLSALFVLAGFFLHIVGRERGGRAGAVWLLVAWCLCWPLAFFSKETGALFPLFVLAWELIVRRNRRGHLDRFARVLTAVVGLCFAAGLVYAVSPSGQWLWAGYGMRSFSLTERLLTEGRVLWFYLGLIVFPRLEAFGLYHDDIALSTGLIEPWTTLPAWLGLVGLVLVAWRTRRQAPLLSFGIAWFLVGHSLESTVLPLEIAHEHRNYMPLFGVTLIGAWMTERAIALPGWKKTLGLMLALGVFGYFVLVTTLRAHQFGDEIRRTQIESVFHRESARTHYEAGRALVARLEIVSADSPQYSFARSHYEQAGKIDPDFKFSWLGLVHLNCSVGRPAENEWVEQLSRRLRESPFGPGDRSVLYGIKEMSNAGTLCLSRAEIERLFAAAGANPTTTLSTRAVLHSWLADYMTLTVRDLPLAQAELDKSLAIAPYNSSNRLKRAQLAFLQGHYDEARALLSRLGDEVLVNSERDTAAMLRDCLDPKGSARCVGK